MLNDEVNEDDDALVGESQLVAQEDQTEVMVDNETPVFYVQLVDWKEKKTVLFQA